MTRHRFSVRSTPIITRKTIIFKPKTEYNAGKSVTQVINIKQSSLYSSLSPISLIPQNVYFPQLSPFPISPGFTFHFYASDPSSYAILRTLQFV